MGKKVKTNQTQSSTQTSTPVQTADTQYYRDLVHQGADFTSGVKHQYGQAENAIEEQFFEDDLPSDIRKRVKAGQMFNLSMDRGAAIADAKNREHMFKTGQAGALNAQTMGQTQSGHGTMQGTTRESGLGTWLPQIASSAIGGASSIAGAKAGCWIAEAIYGETDPRTHLLRLWLNTEFIKRRLGRIVMTGYLAFGERIAEVVKRSTFLKRGLKPLFDHGLKHANQWAKSSNN